MRAPSPSSVRQVFGFFAAWKASLPLVRSYFYASLGVAALVTGAELARTVCHFTMKGDILDACAASYDSDVASGSLSAATVASYCKQSWRNSSYVRLGTGLPLYGAWRLTRSRHLRRSTLRS